MIDINKPFAIVVDCDVHITLPKVLNQILHNQLVCISEYADIMYNTRGVLRVFKMHDVYRCWGYLSVAEIPGRLPAISLSKLLKTDTIYGEL